MLEPRFCYRISAEVGLASDGEGNDSSCLTQANFEGGKFLSKEDYNKLHEKLKKTLANQTGISEEYFECISQEEYDENQDENAQSKDGET